MRRSRRNSRLHCRVCSVWEFFGRKGLAIDAILGLDPTHSERCPGMLEVIQINSSELQLGMYVSGLDRPWLEVPFPMQGFRLESPEDILRVQKYCQYVFIDSTKSVVSGGKAPRKAPIRQRKTNQQIFRGRKLKAYQDSACLLYTSPSPRDRTRSRMPSSA